MFINCSISCRCSLPISQFLLGSAHSANSQNISTDIDGVDVTSAYLKSDLNLILFALNLLSLVEILLSRNKTFTWHSAPCTVHTYKFGASIYALWMKCDVFRFTNAFNNIVILSPASPKAIHTASDKKMPGGRNNFELPCKQCIVFPCTGWPNQLTKGYNNSK